MRHRARQHPSLEQVVARILRDYLHDLHRRDASRTPLARQRDYARRPKDGALRRQPKNWF